VIWLAHALSLARLPLAGLLWWLVRDQRAALAIVLAAALTDGLDGRVARLARRRGDLRADLGGWLDPLCDKLFAVGALVALAVRLDVDLATLALIAARDLLMTPLVLIYGLTSLHRRYPVELRAAWPGKLTTVAQFVALVWLLARVRSPLVPAALCAALGLYALADYLARGLRARPRP
jgi:phosphatidylglycerophosphate synthase